MIKLNRTTEYGLLALSYIRKKSADGLSSPQTSSAREIAEHFKLPFEILAKTLQRLKEQGIIGSTYGTRGGYVLARDLHQLNLGEFLNLMEGPVAVVSCASKDPREHTSCEYSTECSIQHPMQALNSRIAEFLNRISVEELTRDHEPSQLRQEFPHRIKHAAELSSAFAPTFGEEP